MFMDSVTLLANVAALSVSALTSPLIFKSTVGWVSTYIGQMYGSGFSGLASVAYFIVLSVGVFAICRASIATLLVAGGLALASRLFV